MAKFVFENLLHAETPNSEKTVHKVIKESFGDDWIVFHGLNYVLKDKSGAHDGEIDLILYNEKYGILIIEVKGGWIRLENGKWFSGNYLIDPFNQAMRNKYALNRLLGRPKIPIAHAVCFPSGQIPQENIPPEAKNIIIQKRDLKNLENRCIEILSDRKILKNSTEDPISVEKIIEILAPSYNKLSTEIKSENNLFSDFTKKQWEVLKFLRNSKRVNVYGCAGSGKTFIAQNLAVEFAKSGKKVLFVCYNILLADVLNKKTQNIGNLKTVAFYEFCIESCKISKEEIEKYKNNSKTWEKAIPKLMRIKGIEQANLSYDVVIVDEGQDFCKEAWKTIEMLVAPDGYFHVFYDPDQNINQPTYKIPKAPMEIPLTTNHRNTKNIFRKIRPLITIDGVSANRFSPKGSGVEEYFIENSEERLKKLCDILQRLKSEKIRGSSIVILGAHSIKNTCLENNGIYGGYNIEENTKIHSQGTIPYMTYMKFKGCEASVAILIDVDKSDPRWSDNALYTAMSRAQNLLIILWKTKK